MTPTPTIRELVEFGLNSIPEDRTVTVSLRDLLFIHQTLAELNRFFHQPDHYPNIEAVREFLGSHGNDGGYDALAESYYTKLRGMLPTDIEALFTEGAFEHPLPPRYYNSGA